jgi:hypothetical protein
LSCCESSIFAAAANTIKRTHEKQWLTKTICGCL